MKANVKQGKTSVITIKSPGLGIHPYEMGKVIGKKINKDLKIDDYINLKDLV